MSDEKYWNLMSRYLANDLSLQETEELLEWMNEDPSRGDLLKELQDTWDKTRNYPENFHVDTRAAWQKLKSSINVEGQQPKVKPINSLKWIGIAASLVLCLTAGIIAYLSYKSSRLITVETFAGQSKQLVLPDGSKVWMNGKSSLSYPENFNEENLREVSLQGEAFFEVVKNPEKHFVIHTAKTITKVLGTSFDVKQEEDGNVKVAVVTGKVSFSPKNNTRQELILIPGEAGVISQEGYVAKHKYADKNFLYWKNKQLSFSNAPLSEVVKTLEDAYRVKFYVSNPGLLSQKITTSFSNASLSQVVDVLEAVLEVNIEKTDSIYVVGKKQ